MRIPASACDAKKGQGAAADVLLYLHSSGQSPSMNTSLLWGLAGGGAPMGSKRKRAHSTADTAQRANKALRGADDIEGRHKPSFSGISNTAAHDEDTSISLLANASGIASDKSSQAGAQRGRTRGKGLFASAIAGAGIARK